PGELEVGLQETPEGLNGFVVIGHGGDLRRAHAGRLQAVLQRPRREACVALLAREPLFLGGGYDRPVAQYTGRAVMVERGDSDDCRHAAGSPLSHGARPIITNSPPSASVIMAWTWARRRSAREPRGSSSNKERR